MQSTTRMMRRTASTRPAQVLQHVMMMVCPGLRPVHLTPAAAPAFVSHTARRIAAAANQSNTNDVQNITATKPASTSDLQEDGKVGGSSGGPSKVKLVGISGSFRKASSNSGLLRAAAQHMPQGVTFEILDISQIPVYNDDLWNGGDLKNDDSALPESVRTFRAKVAAADGIIFGATEYNYSVSSPLKNVIDWGSKGPNVWQGKVFSAMGAGGGAGTARAQEHLRAIMTGLSAVFVPGRSIQVNRFVGGQFDDHGDVTDKTLKQWVAEQSARTADWARKFKLLEATKQV